MSWWIHFLRVPTNACLGAGRAPLVRPTCRLSLMSLFFLIFHSISVLDYPHCTVHELPELTAESLVSKAEHLWQYCSMQAGEEGFFFYSLCSLHPASPQNFLDKDLKISLLAAAKISSLCCFPWLWTRCNHRNKGKGFLWFWWAKVGPMGTSSDTLLWALVAHSVFFPFILVSFFPLPCFLFSFFFPPFLLFPLLFSPFFLFFPLFSPFSFSPSFFLSPFSFLLFFSSPPFVLLFFTLLFIFTTIFFLLSFLSFFTSLFYLLPPGPAMTPGLFL